MGETKSEPEAVDPSKPLFYDEYDALPLKQNQGKSMLEFDTLDEALDEFFAKVSPPPPPAHLRFTCIFLSAFRYRPTPAEGGGSQR